MNDTYQSVTILAALLMIGYGLWLVSPSAMYIGVGSILLAGVVATRILPVRNGSNAQ